MVLRRALFVWASNPATRDTRPPPQVAAAREVVRRAGHGVAALLKIYAHSIDVKSTPSTGVSPRPSTSMGAEQDLGNEGDSETQQAS